MYKTEPIEIVYSEEDREFRVVKGFVDLGFMGSYPCETISVNFDRKQDMESIFERENQSEYYIENYAPLKSYLKKGMTTDEIAQGLTNFYNARIADINKHQVELNQVFLAYILDDLSGCDFPLWKECPDYIDGDKMPDCDEDDLFDEFYGEEAYNAIVKLYGKLEEKPNNGEVNLETPAEDILKKYFPMFKFDKFLSDIYGEYLYLNKANVVFQCSGKGQAVEIACGAYAEITAKNSFCDWHNH